MVWCIVLLLFHTSNAFLLQNGTAVISTKTLAVHGKVVATGECTCDGVNLNTVIQGDAGLRWGAQQNLVLYFNFDDGTATDQSGNGLHGTLSAGITTLSIGKYDGGLSFTSTDTITVPYNVLLPTGNSPYTVMGWVKGSTTFTVQSYLYHIGGSTTRTSHWMRYVGDGIITAGWWDDNHDSIDTYTTATMAEWHLLGASYDGSTRKIWLDGDVVGVSTVSTPNGCTNTDMWIGYPLATHASRASFAALDEFRVYNKALSDGVMQWLVTNKS